MDSFTASVGLILVHLCIAAIMLGAYSAIPSEICTRHWALSSVLVSIGVPMVVLNAGAPRYAILVIGNNLLILGLIVLWWGIQAFFKKARGKTGWYILGGFFLLYGALLAANAQIASRAILATLVMLLLLGLCVREVWQARQAELTLGTTIAMGGLIVLIVSAISRMAGMAAAGPAFALGNLSAAGVGAVFWGPMCGALLLFSGLLLLHFEELVRQKDHLATHDELTGVLNRRAIDAAGRREVELAVRLKHSLCVAMVDIDLFKQINDQLGHQAGDAVICEVAQVLQKLCRNIDLVGRYGGEEFCVIFPMLSSDGAEVVAERIVSTMRNHGFGPPVHLTVSAGVAAWSQISAATSWENLVARADAELYKAKNGGRDRYSVSISPESGPDAAPVAA